LWCWGNNGSGQLGDASTTSRDAPAQESSGSAWKAVSAGASHTCAIKSDGTLWCWGADGSGQLGNGAGISGNQTSPVQESSGSAWKAVSAGDSHTCAVKSDGTLWCWGADGSGQLGNGGVTGSQQDPSQESSGSTWIEVSADEVHTCAVKSDGTLWCWGSDADGRLGNGAAVTANQVSPYAVTGGGTWKKISAGFNYTCGIKTGGTAWCWGDDAVGKLGNGASTTADQDSPRAVLGGGNWVDISASTSNATFRHTCGLSGPQGNAKAYCWGFLSDGQHGTGVWGYTESPGQSKMWCSDPSYGPAVMIYNSDHKLIQYCDGAGWVKAGK